ncbi:hypothetical protein J2T57_000362 [Natronocella acetinitrilica]|uniref:Uncharacterized protein n=1 Tax=Natronocella acetinitrilica TaxID=414046 RepID=A0AAE3G078_9GAMM|nr:hypothetical protein [Natronocella acetinitrilica]
MSETVSLAPDWPSSEGAHPSDGHDSSLAHTLAV